jgi:uncharacterized heparinase superfamily protein
MSEQTTETPAEVEDAAQQPPEGEQAQAAKTYDEEYVKALRAEAAKYRTAAKQAQTEAEKRQRESMTEAERAVAEAETRGWTSAVEALGERLVRSQFLAAAAKRNPDYDAEPLIEDLNLKKYIGDDGEPDGKGIVKAAERLVPARSGPPSFDGGARKSAPGAPDMNQLLRAAAGRE